MVTALLAGAILLAADTRLITEIDRDVSAALKAEATAKQPAARSAALQRLCDLHDEIVADERLAKSEGLKTIRARLWSRLTRVKQQLQRELPEADEAIGRDKDQIEEDAARYAAVSLASTLALADQASGGPSTFLARGGGAMTERNAEDLIELIERTINPDFWDVNGGPGTIMYYPNLQCLVIRATGEVHGDVGRALGGVRAAGR